MQAPSISCVLKSSALKTPQPFRIKQKRGRSSLTGKVKHATVTSKFELNPPPYPMNALEPHMSRETLDYHWGRHHRAHVESLNEQIVGTELDGMCLEDIIISTYNKGDPLPSFNHAAQIWNHDFFWNSMKPSGGGRPSGALLKLIERDFGSLERLLKEFKRVAVSQFGSGWVWLVYKANKLDVGNAVNPRPREEDNKLLVVKTPNAVNPLIWDYSPLLGLDVWEHAYHLDYENRCADYVSVFIENLVSWEVVSLRLEKSVARAEEKARQAERRSEEEEMDDGEVAEMYLDSESDDSEAE